jgi:predicted acyl esterase
LAADQFPPEKTADTKYYLDGGSRALSPDPPASAASASYDAATPPSQVSFIVGFDKETTLVGYPMAHLWVEAEGVDDADLFVVVQKLSANGTPLQEFTVPNQGAMIQDATERTGSVLRYRGSPGRLRLSARHLDDTLSTPTVPEHTFDRVEKLQQGQVVDVQVDLFPIGLVFHPGQQLRLVIGARNTLGAIMPGIAFYDGNTEGKLTVHTGGSQASYLSLPVLAT